MKKYMTLKELRESRNLTIRELADKLGVSRQTVCHYEMDICQPPDSVWLKIIEIFRLKGKNTQKSKYFRKRKPVKLYTNGDTCKVKGCEEKPTSKGYCAKHYISVWRRRKKQQMKLLQVKNNKQKMFNFDK